MMVILVVVMAMIWVMAMAMMTTMVIVVWVGSINTAAMMMVVLVLVLMVRMTTARLSRSVFRTTRSDTRGEESYLLKGCGHVRSLSITASPETNTPP